MLEVDIETHHPDWLAPTGGYENEDLPEGSEPFAWGLNSPAYSPPWDFPLNSPANSSSSVGPSPSPSLWPESPPPSPGPGTPSSCPPGTYPYTTYIPTEPITVPPPSPNPGTIIDEHLLSLKVELQYAHHRAAIAFLNMVRCSSNPQEYATAS